MELRSAARAAALTACLSLACWHGPAPAPLVPVAVVPFDGYGGAIYVPATINGDSTWLMLDTGLSRTGLDRDWARTVGIVPGPAPAAPAASTAVVDTIRIGALTLLNHTVALYPLHGLSEASGRLQVGLVGHDVLKYYTVEIDYRQRRVRLFDPARYRYEGTGATVRFTADADLPLLRAHVKVRGRRAIPARLLLDTGASGLCLILTTPFAEQHGLSRVTPAIEAPIGTGLVGDLHGTIVRLQEVRLGSVKIPSPTTGLGGEYKGFLARTDIDGVVGNSVFEGSRLILDYAGGRAIVEPRPGDSSPCDFDMSGLRLAARGPGLRHVVVDYVVPRSPSAEVGIAVGDELLLIDGRAVAEGDLSDARKALRIDGAVRQLVLRRDADTIRVALRLRRLL
jgi:predicted aspartyl protease